MSSPTPRRREETEAEVDASARVYSLLKNPSLGDDFVVSLWKTQFEKRGFGGLKPNDWLVAATTGGHNSVADFILRNAPEITIDQKYDCLQLALELKKKAIAILLIEHGTPLQLVDRDESLAYRMIEIREKTGLMLLIAHKCELNIQKSNGESLVHLTVKSKSLELLELLVRKEVDVNVRDGEGLTPLMWATQIGDETAARILVDAGADLEMVNTQEYQETVAILSVRLGREDLVDFFSQAKSKFLVWDAEGMTPAHIAAIFGHASMLQTMHNYKHPMEALSRDMYRETPLFKTARRNDLTCFVLVRAISTSPESANGVGETCLLIASEKGFDGIVGHCIDMEEDLDRLCTVTRNGETNSITPFLAAASAARYDMVQMLFDYGADENAQDSKGRTAVMRCVPEGNCAMIEKLIDLEVDMEKRDKQGKTVYVLAVEEGNFQVLNSLTKPKPTKITQKMGVDNVKIRMRNRRAAIEKILNKIDELEGTPLHHVAREGNEAMAKLLVDRGCDPAMLNANGETALDVARRCEKWKVAKFLNLMRDKKELVGLWSTVNKDAENKPKRVRKKKEEKSTTEEAEDVTTDPETPKTASGKEAKHTGKGKKTKKAKTPEPMETDETGRVQTSSDEMEKDRPTGSSTAATARSEAASSDSTPASASALVATEPASASADIEPEKEKPARRSERTRGAKNQTAAPKKTTPAKEKAEKKATPAKEKLETESTSSAAKKRGSAKTPTKTPEKKGPTPAKKSKPTPKKRALKPRKEVLKVKTRGKLNRLKSSSEEEEEKKEDSSEGSQDQSDGKERERSSSDE